MEKYLAQLELVAEIDRWNDTLKAPYLVVNLTSQAQTVLGDLEPTARKIFTELIHAVSDSGRKTSNRAALKIRNR